MLRHISPLRIISMGPMTDSAGAPLFMVNPSLPCLSQADEEIAWRDDFDLKAIRYRNASRKEPLVARDKVAATVLGGFPDMK